MNLILVSGHNHKSFIYQGRRLSSVECQDERISYSVIVCMCACPVAKLYQTLLSPGPQHTRLLSPWDSPSKNADGRYNFLLQGIFPIQGSNPCLLHLLHWQVDSLTLTHLGSPYLVIN